MIVEDSTQADATPVFRREADSLLRLRNFEFVPRSQETSALALPLQEIHLWHANTEGSHLETEKWEPLLSSDERERASRFHFARHRQEFTFAHGMLRSVLGRYLGTAPQHIQFSYSSQGKPSLSEPYSSSGLRFNLSHTDGRVLIAVCSWRTLGVDVERVRAIEFEDIAKRFFSSAEQDALMRLQQTLRPQAFFHCWTRKEALLKARGDGLSFPLDLFDVSIAADEREVTLITRPDASEAQRWRILRIDVPTGYAAAVAVGLYDSG
jgi:4'-phosphopantetheinyl transferase